MAAMGGCFSIMTLFSCAEDGLERIETDLNVLEAMGFQASLYEAEDPATVPVFAALPLKVQVTAMDHPGIVQKVVHVLRMYDVNIVSLETQVTQAPYTGAALFNLNLEAVVPESIPILQVKQELIDLSAEMNLDLAFSK